MVQELSHAQAVLELAEGIGLVGLQLLDSGDAPMSTERLRQAVTGLGGMGKTRLAVEVCLALEGRRSAYCHAARAEGLEGLASAIAAALEVTPSADLLRVDPFHDDRTGEADTAVGRGQAPGHDYRSRRDPAVEDLAGLCFC